MDLNDNFSNYKEVIEKQGFLIQTTVGTSMYPMLVSPYDSVKLVKPTDLKKYDVILYQRKNKQFVLHRIIEVNNNEYTLCGDNQYIKEKHVKPSQIIGKVEGFYKKEKYYEVTNESYIKYYLKVVKRRPFKYFIHLPKTILIKILRFLKLKK